MRWDGKRIPRPLEPIPSAIAGEVRALQFKGPASAAEGIAAICRAYVLSDQLKPEDITILISRNKLAQRIVEALESINDVSLPVTVLTPMWPLGMGNGKGAQGRLVYCLLRLLVDRNDAMALRTWLQLQKGIGPKTIDAVRYVLY